MEHRLPPTRQRATPLSLSEVACAESDHKPTPIVLLHGATYGAAMFDIQVPGYSLQAFLAARGSRSFALDVRGYGRSLPAPELDAPPEDNAPFARLQDTVADLNTAVRYILEQTGAASLHVVAFSWGTVVAAVLACRHPELINRLVLYAPLYGETNELWIERLAAPGDRTRLTPNLGAYRWIDRSGFRLRWDRDLPEGADLDAYREERVLDAAFDALVAADPLARTCAHPAFRAPTGALVDMFDVFNGRPLYDPGRIGSPTLLIRGEEDTTSTESDALRLFNALGATHKSYVAIAPGSHFLCAERNAQALFGQIELFLQ